MPLSGACAVVQTVVVGQGVRDSGVAFVGHARRPLLQREEVVHLVALTRADLSAELASVGNREVPTPGTAAATAHHGGSGIDPPGMPKGRNIVDPYEHIDRIKVLRRDFR